MAATSPSADRERSWSDLRLLVISTDPFAVESLVTRLEGLGAEPAVHFGIPDELEERPNVLFLDPKLADLQPEDTLRLLRSTVDQNSQNAAPGVFLLDGPLAAAVIQRLRDELPEPSAEAVDWAGEGVAPCIRVLPPEADLRAAMEDLLVSIRHWSPEARGESHHAGGLDIRVVSVDPQRSPQAAPEPAAEVTVPPLAPAVVEEAETEMPGEPVAEAAVVEEAPFNRLVTEEPLTEEPVVEDRHDGTARLLRAVVTVLAVSALLWFAFSRLGPDAEPTAEPRLETPLAGQAGSPRATTAENAATQIALLGVGTAEVGGRVTRADTGGSIGGATVVATGPSGPVATITDSQGRFRFSGLKGGTYVVVISVPRFVARQVQVVVPEGGSVEDVNLRLDPEGS